MTLRIWTRKKLQPLVRQREGAVRLDRPGADELCGANTDGSETGGDARHDARSGARAVLHEEQGVGLVPQLQARAGAEQAERTALGVAAADREGKCRIARDANAGPGCREGAENDAALRFV